MLNTDSNSTTRRRGFLGILGGTLATLGLTTLAAPLSLNARNNNAPSKGHGGEPKSEADAWFDKVKGKHRVVFDATRPHEIMPFVWPKVFILTNAATGTPEADCGVVLVLRHDAICYAFQDAVWAKYNFGDTFKAHEIGGAFQAADAATATKTRNPFWKTKEGDFKVPGFGAVPIGISDLMKSGVMICVCNAAMTVYANALAPSMKMTGDEVYKEWKEALIPGIQVVPSGVWALGRAKEHDCAYIFAG
jgi:intracellular sulfur oxidation DsrE/DsrF family protein